MIDGSCTVGVRGDRVVIVFAGGEAGHMFDVDADAARGIGTALIESAAAARQNQPAPRGAGVPSVPVRNRKMAKSQMKPKASKTTAAKAEAPSAATRSRTTTPTTAKPAAKGKTGGKAK